jgi:bifunctional ADP-heptose synthase (sugar kinase/adenylyltransferase)
MSMHAGLPAKATEVRDVCGAEDTVLAAIGAATLDA